VEIELTPEPSPEERAAIELALRESAAEGDARSGRLEPEPGDDDLPPGRTAPL
jgi:hypothetical protein